MRRAKWKEGQPNTENQKKLIESRWNKASKYVWGEMAHDAERGLRILRLMKGQAGNVTTCIEHGAMLFIPSDESCAAELTYGFG